MTRPYFVVDLEATCDQPESFPRSESEIIEIGGVLVDPGTLEPIDEFQTFVQPQLHPRLTAFCTELTSIQQHQVQDAPVFAEAVVRMKAWLAGREVLLASWGAYDQRQLDREARRHRVGLPWGRDHLNLKAEFGRVAGKRMGCGGALRRAGLRFEGTPHRGIDDARNIVRLMPFALRRQALPRRG